MALEYAALNAIDKEIADQVEEHKAADRGPITLKLDRTSVNWIRSLISERISIIEDCRKEKGGGAGGTIH